MRIELTGSSHQPVASFWRYRIISWLVALAVFMTVVFFGFRWIERAITFHPVRYAPGESWTVPPGAEDVWFKTADGIDLHGWFFESDSSRTVIYFHGNGGNISHIGWLGERLHSEGLNVLLFDYRGYGRSEGRIADEAALYADANAAYDYIVARQRTDPNAVVLYGQSLGTAAATELASQRGCGALILESGLSSASDMAKSVFPWLPRAFHRLGRNRFDSAAKLARIDCPVLITHGDPDPVIPAEQAHVLFAAAREPKELLIFPGAGHNVFGRLGKKYQDHLSSFINAAVKE